MRFEGADAIHRFVEEWRRNYAEYELELAELHDLGEGLALAVTSRDARPAGSVGPGRLHAVIVYLLAWADGMIVHVSAHNDTDEARAVAERLAGQRG